VSRLFVIILRFFLLAGKRAAVAATNKTFVNRMNLIKTYVTHCSTTEILNMLVQLVSHPSRHDLSQVTKRHLESDGKKG
jgi:hypothetical protein